MGQLLSLCDARADRVKARLCELAGSHRPGMVETRDGLIDARRIFCRDAGAVLIDRYGVQTRVAYGEITDVSSVLPVSEIIRLANWQVAPAEEEPPQEAAILRFPANRST